jgi:hypothetical protein
VTRTLADLRPLRSAPTLDGGQRQTLALELQERLAACRWCTVGIMAPAAVMAIDVLRQLELALGWEPLALGGEPLPVGPVFLKGNQHTGLALLRAETGLGEGVLISGHGADDPAQEDTWGPLPLDFFTPPAQVTADP